MSHRFADHETDRGLSRAMPTTSVLCVHTSGGVSRCTQREGGVQTMSDQGCVRIYRMPSGTTEQYDTVVAAAGDVIAAGARVHLAGANDDDLWVIEVWPSADALAQWRAEQEAGNAAQAELLPNPEIIEFDLHRLLLAD